MAKTQRITSDDLKRPMWERLSQSPDKLDLDKRADEEPEDLFVRLYNTGRKKQVISAIKANLCEIVAQVEKKGQRAALRFMRRAMRLCDIVGAHECKPALKLILLDESRAVWGKDFEELQELAARALDGMPKEASEFRYWSDLVERGDAVLPYALNALIEIDVDRGLERLCSIYIDCAKKKREDVVDWEAVLQIAAHTHGVKAVGRALDKIFAGNPVAYEYFVRLSGIPEISRVGQRSIEDIASYSTGSIVKGEAKIDVAGQLGLFKYELAKGETARVRESETAESLTGYYGTLAEPQELLSDLEKDHRWRYLPPKGNIDLPS